MSNIDLSKYDPVDITSLEKVITFDALVELERDMFTGNEEFKDSLYLGNVLLIINCNEIPRISEVVSPNSGKLKHCEHCPIINVNEHLNFTQQDKEKIHRWLENKEHHYYYDKLFRLDLENKILLIEAFNIYNENNEKVRILSGHALKNNLEAKFHLLEYRQTYIMKHFMSGEEVANGGA